MTLAATLTGLRLPVRRVALGPSLGGCRVGLQQRLGADWVVHDLISDDALDGPDDVVVLGTEEVEPGRMQVTRHGRSRSVLIGTRRARASAGREADTLQPIVDTLAEALRRLAGPAHPAAA